MTKFISKHNLSITIFYTIGHFIIAVLCNHFITKADMRLATIDAIIEPMINALWFHVLNYFYQFK